MVNHKELGTEASAIVADLHSYMQKLRSLRSSTSERVGEDISLGKFVNEQWGFDYDPKTGISESFFNAIGINPSLDSLTTIANDSGDNRRWLVPEIIREAVRQGIRTAMWADLIAAEENVRNMKVITPSIDLSNAYPKETAQGASIPVGTVQMTDKSVNLKKITTAVKITYEVASFTSINLIALYMEDVGVMLNHKINYELLSVLLNGDQEDGSLSAPVVGVLNTTQKITYADILKAWVKMSMIGRMPDAMIAAEDVLEAVMLLSEFKDRGFSDRVTEKTLSVKTPIPEIQSIYGYGAVPATNLVIMDTKAALVKYNAQALLIENDKDIMEQTLTSTASLITGFGVLNRDARLQIKNDATLGAVGASNGYPTYMSASNFHKAFA